ncbi:hypothetical protein BKA65DRAFT_150287 [Rhexocercosporidium sp. MPI-PUGE-AT-0058]|nr:hypothetical protein BKA65DRAFT_150287 [Rhexocercosporidium sp. MPI-PUGE-AT-0058]
MEYDSKGPILKVLLLLNDQSGFSNIQSSLLPFPDGLLGFEHTLQTLHSAVPSADTIYISTRDESQESKIKFRLDNPSPLFPPHAHSDHDHDHYSPQTPRLETILAEAGFQESGYGAVSGLLAAHKLHPDAKWLVLCCGFPLLPPPALQQLVLECRDPVTCFVREDGVVEPLLGIWGSEALERLSILLEGETVDERVLGRVIEELQGKLVKPLREEWIVKPRTNEEWKIAMMTWEELRGAN